MMDDRIAPPGARSPCIDHNNLGSEPRMDRVDCVVIGAGVIGLAVARRLAQAARDAKPILDHLRDLLANQLAEVEKQMNHLGAPWTPGRIPEL